MKRDWVTDLVWLLASVVWLAIGCIVLYRLCAGQAVWG